MGILSFEKPKRLRKTSEHNKMYSSDSGIPGTYVPNMSKEDEKKFKAKHIRGDHERIEIRVTLGGANVNIFVFKNKYFPDFPDWPDYDEYFKGMDDPAYIEARKVYYEKEKNFKNSHNEIMISTNGKIAISFEQMGMINEAIEEARQILFENGVKDL